MLSAQEVQALQVRYLGILERVEKAVVKAKRQKDDVVLVAVSKFHPAECIRVLAQLGHKDFGESYVQEALQKQDELADLQLNWHMIGHVQSKKAKSLASFCLVHSLDSLNLAKELAKRLEPNQVQPMLVQINVGCEEQKSGLPVAQAEVFFESFLSEPELSSKINICGLMCLPPAGGQSEVFFISLNKLRDKLQNRFNIALPYLSMGMSADFESAIAQGANFIRIGTDIFGER